MEEYKNIFIKKTMITFLLPFFGTMSIYIYAIINRLGDASLQWLPLISVYYFIIYIIYSLVFMGIDKISSKTFKHFFIINGILSIIIIIQSLLFYYIDIDWNAINTGDANLSLFEAIIIYDFTIIVVLISSLIIHLFITLYQKNKRI